MLGKPGDLIERAADILHQFVQRACVGAIFLALGINAAGLNPRRVDADVDIADDRHQRSARILYLLHAMRDILDIARRFQCHMFRRGRGLRHLLGHCAHRGRSGGKPADKIG